MHLFFNRKPVTKQRFIELDIMRSFAIIMMIFFHVLWDLSYYGLSTLDGELYQYGKCCPFIFLLLVGICLSISAQKKDISSFIVKGGFIFSIGMILTTFSLLLFPERPIFFGVLHCIGLSIILSGFFVKLRKYNIIAGSLIGIAGVFVDKIHVASPNYLQLIIGLHQTEMWRYSIDYFPLFPWFGVALLGIGVGNILYKDGKRQFYFPEISNHRPVKAVSWFSRHSLLMYLVHQPIIVSAITIYMHF